MEKTPDFYINIAKVQAENFSTCLRRKVGAIITDSNGIIISVGVNHAPHKIRCVTCKRQEEGIPSGEHLELCYALHAEASAILKALKTKHSLEHATLYITTYPCSHCAKLILESGIKTVYYEGDYNDALSQEILASISLKRCVQYE